MRSQRKDCEVVVILVMFLSWIFFYRITITTVCAKLRAKQNGCKLVAQLTNFETSNFKR